MEAGFPWALAWIGDEVSRWLRALDGGAEMGRAGGVVSPDHHSQLS